MRRLEVHLFQLIYHGKDSKHLVTLLFHGVGVPVLRGTIGHIPRGFVQLRTYLGKGWLHFGSQCMGWFSLFLIICIIFFRAFFLSYFCFCGQCFSLPPLCTMQRQHYTLPFPACVHRHDSCVIRTLRIKLF